MSGAIEEAAKKFLVDPGYFKVFKHTFDVLEDYICQGLIAIGAIGLSVRFLSSLGTGETVCVLLGVEHANATFSESDLHPYPAGSTLAMVTYANFNQRCVDASLTKFMQFAPFILLIQALVVIMVEKFFLKIPRVSGKMERFYINIVEESLFGKDPDVAEDVFDEKANSEAISRRRRRNEVCMSLKRSNVIHHVYVGKNILEVCLLAGMIAINVFYAQEAVAKNQDPKHSCEISMMELPDLNLGNGTLHFQCNGKKVHFFIILIYIQIVLQFCCVICSSGSLVWCHFFRSISGLIKSIAEDDDEDFEDFEEDKDLGTDFLFLFDLLAHSSGIESTLRVLTHSDQTFRQICLPRLKGNPDDHIKVEEAKLKVVWSAAKIETWLLDNPHRGFRVDCYDVTIFPAESSRNQVSMKAKLWTKEVDPLNHKYVVNFADLAGGKTEYIVTIACVIGRSRMKGSRIATNLLPYGPEKPRGGMVKTLNTHDIEVAWEPPKGEFTKYILSVDPNILSTVPLPPVKLPPIPQPYFNRNNFSVNRAYSNDGSFSDLSKSTTGYSERDVSCMMTSFPVTGLQPGEIYGLAVKTKTGDRITRTPIQETVLTRPERVASLTATLIQTESLVLKWVAPEGHSKLKAFNILCVSKDGKWNREFAVKHKPESPVNSFSLENMPSATEFNLSITTVCVFDKLKTVSEEEKIVFITLPFPPKNLELESRFCNSFQVKWEAGLTSAINHKYKLFIQSESIGYSSSYEVGGDRHAFNFSKLPDIVGTGEAFFVRVTYCVTPVGSDEEVESEGVSGTYVTKPLAPTNFKVGARSTVLWTKSPTPNVRLYKLKLKSIEEGGKPDEFLIPAQDDNEPLSFKLEDLVFGVQYRVNIYALVELHGLEAVESKELHEKIIMTDEGLVIYTEPEPEPNPNA